MHTATGQATEMATAMVAFQNWRERMKAPDAPEYERIGALHYGKVFLQGDDALVRRLAASYYLWIANRFMSPKAPIFTDKVAMKARSILATHFFNMDGDWDNWAFSEDLIVDHDKRLLFDLTDFLCCAQKGIAQGIDWYKWNFWFIDTSLSANSEKSYRDDRVISDFLNRVLWCLFSREKDDSTRAAIQRTFMSYRNIIISEIFLRAPWQLLPFALERGDTDILETLQCEIPERYPRAFDKRIDKTCERIQDSPYLALPTRSEVLLILRSRL
jgi:hypothetical protein